MSQKNYSQTSTKNSQNSDDPSQPSTGAESDAVGHVVVLDNLVVTHNGEETRIQAYVNRETRDEIKTGTYIQIPYPDPGTYTNAQGNTVTDEELTDEMFAMVESVRYMSANEIDELSENLTSIDIGSESSERRYNLVMDLSPIGIITKTRENGEVVPEGRKNVDAVPKPFTHVYKCTQEAYLRKGLNIPKEGLSIGHMAANGQPIPNEDPLIYNVRNPGAGASGESAVFRHTMIAGSTGKGKTFFTKNYLRQLMDGTKYETESVRGEPLNPQKPGIVLIDPENEYSEMRFDNDSGDQALLKELERNGVQTGGIENSSDFTLESFVPDVKGTNTDSLSLKTSRKFTIPFHIVQDNMELVMPFEAKGPTKSAMSKMLGGFFNNSFGLGFESTYSGFVKWIDHFGEKDSFEQNDVANRYNINESVWDAAVGRFKNNTFDRVFDTGAESLTSGTLLKKMFNPGRVSVIPTDHLDPATEKLVVMSLMSIIVENKIGMSTLKAITETPLILGVDEAHNFLSDYSSVQGRYVIDKFQIVAKQGRKYKLGMFMVTQNPEDIDDDIIKQTNTKVFLGLEPEVLERINIPYGYKHQIPNFGKGQAVVNAPDVKPAEILGFPVCLTKHDS